MIPRAALFVSLAVVAVSAPTYVHDKTLHVDGLGGVSFDPRSGRLWLGSRHGLISVSIADNRMTPAVTAVHHVGDVELAPDLERIFFVAERDQLTYVDLKSPASPVAIGRVDRVTELVYEPVRRELYALTATAEVVVFNAASGERGVRIELPGREGRSPVTIGGRVYLTIAGRKGVFAIDGTTHEVTPQATLGEDSPQAIEVDAANGLFFFAYPRAIAVVDVETGKVFGRRVLTSVGAIAFDPGAGLLIATNPTPPRALETFRVTPGGLEAIDRLKWVQPGLNRLQPTSFGFIQRGDSTPVTGSSPPGHSSTILVWKGRRE